MGGYKCLVQLTCALGGLLTQDDEHDDDIYDIKYAVHDENFQSACIYEKVNEFLEIYFFPLRRPHVFVLCFVFIPSTTWNK